MSKFHIQMLAFAVAAVVVLRLVAAVLRALLD